MSLFAAMAAWCAPQAHAQTHGAKALAIPAGPIVQNVTDTSARIWWQTNRPSSTIVHYGTDPNQLTRVAEQPYGETVHSVTLQGLQPGTLYYFEILQEGGIGLVQSQFRTAGSQQAQQFHITNGPVIEQIAPTSAVVAWTTNLPSSSIVMYGTDPNNLGQRAEAPWGQQTHRVTVNNLKPDTRYYFQVQSGEAQGNGQTAQSSTFMAMTPASGQQSQTLPQK